MTSWTLLLFAGLEDAERTAADHLAGEVRNRFAGRVSVYTVTMKPALPLGEGAASHELLDVLGLAHDRYGVSSPTFYLHRPDTFVAARGPLDQTTDLLRHLAGIFR